MSNANQPQYNKYLEAKVKTASPIQLVCMLYDGAIKFVNLAISGIKEKNIEKKTTNIIKAEKIIDELRLSLNFDKGGEIAKNLDKLYDFIYTYLIDANHNDDLNKLEHVMKMLAMLRDSWQVIASKNPPAQAQQQPVAVSAGAPQPANNKAAVPANPSVERLDVAC